MAKIQLNSGPAQTPAAGGLPQVPPPATLPPGVTGGRPPLPTNRVVATANPARLTPMERAAAERVGWRDGMPIPPEMREAIRQAQTESAAGVRAAADVLPVDPTTPPVSLNVVDVGTLPPAKQQQVEADIALHRQQMAQERANLLSRSEVGRKIDKAKELPLGAPDAPARPATRTVPYTGPGPAAAAPLQQQQMPAPPAQEPTDYEVEQQRLAAAFDEHAQSRPTYVPAAPAPPADEVHQPEEPLAALTHCPHCQWDLSMPEVPEPAYEEKMAFLHATAGDRVYLKRYPLFGGQIHVTFRQLTTMEVDACFRQVMIEQQRGEVQPGTDYFEKINRYRLYLQLMRIESTGVYDHEMPEGLSPKHNPNAPDHWATDEENEPLKAIEQFVLKNLLKSESLARVVQQQCGRFNRLVARLEGLVDNSDFWTATGTPR